MNTPEIKNLKEINTMLASLITEIKAYTDVPIDQQTAPNPTHGTPHSKDHLDTMNKHLVACMGAIQHIANHLDWHASRLDHHSNRMNGMEDKMYQHRQDARADMEAHLINHPMPLISKEHKEAYAKACHMEGEYEVKPKVVYASNSVKATISKY